MAAGVRPAANPVSTPAAQARADSIWAGEPPPRRPLRIAYLLPHHNVTGGMKILVEHVRWLRARGHRVRAVLRGAAAHALPPWTDVQADEERVLAPGEPARRGLEGTDVAVVGWYQSLFEWGALGVPVLYFEQGHEILFGDRPPGELGERLEAQFDAALRLPLPVAAVSPHVAELLSRRFERPVGVIVNGIDLAAYRPAPHPHGHRVLLIGNPRLPFKDFSTALRAIEHAHRTVPDLSVTWVSQVPVTLTATPFPFENVVSPPQGSLPGLYRAHDVLLFTSRYESFPLPPFEAMASGLPVVTTRCGGVTTYARPGWNCAMAAPGDAAALGEALAAVLRDEAVARALAQRGRETAERFSWDAAIDLLEDALLRTSQLSR